MMDNKVAQLKAEVFDLLRQQEVLKVQIQELDRQKNEKLKELAEVEKPLESPQTPENQ